RPRRPARSGARPRRQRRVARLVDGELPPYEPYPTRRGRRPGPVPDKPPGGRTAVAELNEPWCSQGSSDTWCEPAAHTRYCEFALWPRLREVERGQQVLRLSVARRQRLQAPAP